MIVPRKHAIHSSGSSGGAATFLKRITYARSGRSTDYWALSESYQTARGPRHGLVATGYFYGDYYPLTPYNRDETQWIAWQHHLPESETGLVQAFRRKDCPVEAVTLRLCGLGPAATYMLTNLDDPEQPVTMAGRGLLDAGLPMKSTAVPQAILVTYRRNP